MVDKAVKAKKPEETVTIEEEDLFEDFPLSGDNSGTQHGKVDKEAELPLWEADWDDEDIGGDFVQHLKAELAKRS